MSDSQRLANAPAAPALRMLAVLSTLMGFASISTDLYLPALPTMSQALGADRGTIELTIAGYLIGFSVGQLFWGPIGDRYGRRGPIAIGLVFFVIGSIGCALSAGAWEMVGWRVVQAVGACAGVVLARAMVRDIYERDRAARMLSVLITVMAVAPLLGPLIGGQILLIASWRAIFWTLVAIGATTLAALFSLPETLPQARRNAEPLWRAFGEYWALLGNRRLMATAAVSGFYYVGTFAYVAGTPFAFIVYHQVPPQYYGGLFALGTLGVMAANLVNARLVMRWGTDRLLKHGALAAAIAGLVAALVGAMNFGGLAGLAGALFCFIAASGFIVANSIASALARFPERAGAVSALAGAMQYGGGIFGAGLIGLFADGTPRPMVFVIAAAGLGSLASAALIGPANPSDTICRRCQRSTR